MPSGSEQAVVVVGDFVEAEFVAVPAIIRRGVVIQVFNQKSVLVKGWDFESLCDNPTIISLQKLNERERDLLNWVLKKLD